MLRRPPKDSEGNYVRSQKKLTSPPKASKEIEELAVKLNVLGSRDAANMLLASVGAELVLEDGFTHMKVFAVNGEYIYECKWRSDWWKYLTNSDLQDGAHSWVLASVKRLSQ